MPFTADFYIATLNLQEHIEGGYYKELYQTSHAIDCSGLPVAFEGRRPLASTIYYLLKSGQVSKFHRLKFDELWFFHDGSPLLIHTIDTNGELNTVKLGLGVVNGELPQLLIPANTIFGAEILEKDSFGFVSCMVSPGFDYRDFELFTSEALVAMHPKHRKLITRLNG